MATGSEQMIIDRINAIQKNKQFKSWFTTLKVVAEDDIILLNNSFLFRDSVRTSKNMKCLGFSVDSKGKIKDYLVLDGMHTNVDFRHISHKQKDLTKVKLSYAVAEEKKTLGNIIFVLIGLLQDNIKVDVPIQSSIIKRLILDPSTSSISVAGDEITINDCKRR